MRRGAPRSGEYRPPSPRRVARVPGEKHPRARILPRARRARAHTRNPRGFGSKASKAASKASERSGGHRVTRRGRGRGSVRCREGGVGEARTPRRRRPPPRRRRERGRGRRRLRVRIRVRIRVRMRSGAFERARVSPRGAAEDAETRRTRGEAIVRATARRPETIATHFFRVVVEKKAVLVLPAAAGREDVPRRVGAPDEHREPPRGKRRGVTSASAARPRVGARVVGGVFGGCASRRRAREGAVVVLRASEPSRGGGVVVVVVVGVFVSAVVEELRLSPRSERAVGPRGGDVERRDGSRDGRPVRDEPGGDRDPGGDVRRPDEAPGGVRFVVVGATTGGVGVPERVRTRRAPPRRRPLRRLDAAAEVRLHPREFLASGDRAQHAAGGTRAGAQCADANSRDAQQFAEQAPRDESKKMCRRARSVPRIPPRVESPSSIRAVVERRRPREYYCLGGVSGVPRLAPRRHSSPRAPSRPRPSSPAPSPPPPPPPPLTPRPRPFLRSARAFVRPPRE